MASGQQPWRVLSAALRPFAHRPDAGRHPDSAEWERICGQPVPGDTARAQLLAVSRWFLRDQRDAQAVTVTFWGSRPRPALERAAPTSPAVPGE